MKIQTTKLRMIFLSCQEKCVSQLWEENSSSLTELLDFKVVVHEASCVGPSVFLSSEVSLLMFSLTFVGSHSLQDIPVSAPLTVNVTAHLPASDLFQKTKVAHEHLILYIPFWCMREILITQLLAIQSPAPCRLPVARIFVY